LTGGAAQEDTDTVFESSVTAPVSASKLPDDFALVSRVMLAWAITEPMRSVPVPRVAELPTRQKTLQRCAPLISTTDASLAVMSVLLTLKIKTASGLPLALRVSVPVIAAEDAKQ